MISKNDLKELANIRLKDSALLFKNKRYQGAQYLAGYSVELFLKLNVCRLFNLSEGYPENKLELEMYSHVTKANFLNALKRIGLRT